MKSSGLADSTRFLVNALAALYVMAALAGPVLLSFDGTRTAIWVSLLVGGAVLMLLGQRLIRVPALSAAFVSVGAAVGGIQLFWTLIVPIAVATVIACSIALARRESAPA